jgi:hypothetical protein
MLRLSVALIVHKNSLPLWGNPSNILSAALQNHVKCSFAAVSIARGGVGSDVCVKIMIVYPFFETGAQDAISQRVSSGNDQHVFYVIRLTLGEKFH